MPTKVGYIGQWNYYVGGADVNVIPVAKSNANGGYVNTNYHMVNPISYHFYYVISQAGVDQPYLQLDP